MKISGFQKMTLLDFPGKVACTLFTAGCNFRCGFCHNASLVTHIDADVGYSEDEVLDYLKKRQGLLDGVCITGGEPLLQPDIEDFIRKVKALGYSVKLDTNGSLPEKLIFLVEQGLVDYVAMDVKNCKERYAETVGIADFDLAPIEKSVAFLLEGRVDYEFRTTIVKEYHTTQDIVSLGEWIQGAERYFLQNFVDSGDLICGNLSAVDPSDLYNMQQKVEPFVVKTAIRGI